jgi:hypothetical protein
VKPWPRSRGEERRGEKGTWELISSSRGLVHNNERTTTRFVCQRRLHAANWHTQAQEGRSLIRGRS